MITRGWSFGDGFTGSGSFPSHTYPAAGTYQVVLTVTDDKGATATTSRALMVTSPIGVTYASDQFSRVVSAGLGAAPTGGSWTLSNTASSYSVHDGSAYVTTGAGSTPAAYLSSVSAPSVDLRMTFGLDKQPAGSGLYVRAGEPGRLRSPCRSHHVVPQPTITHGSGEAGTASTCSRPRPAAFS